MVRSRSSLAPVAPVSSLSFQEDGDYVMLAIVRVLRVSSVIVSRWLPGSGLWQSSVLFTVRGLDFWNPQVRRLEESQWSKGVVIHYADDFEENSAQRRGAGGRLWRI